MPQDTAAILRQLNRILDSAIFRNAGRLRAFLRYIVEETLAGRGDEIKEYSVGVAVCGRPVSFDPKADAIVRVDATRLRARLASYYETEGAGDELRIELPKGSYVPTFLLLSPAQDQADHRPISLAVLPFVNFSPAREHEELVDSLTEELIHALARIRELRVIARGSVFHFRTSGEEGREIGRHFGVDHVIEGSVRVSGSRVRIGAQLTDVPHGWLLWSDKYECAWESVFSVQDQIIAGITDALNLNLTGDDEPAIFTRATGNPDAYADYLRGRHHWNRRTPESLAASLVCYERALARDPACVPAYTGIADTLVVMALNDQEPALTVMPRAHSAARKALELRPGWPEGLASLGCVKSVLGWDWEGGARDFTESIRRQPGSARAHYLYGITNAAPCGRWPEAMSEMEAAIRLDPASPVLLRDAGLIHFMRRNWKDAEASWDEAEKLDPAFRGTLYWRARLAIETGRFEDALGILKRRIDAGSSNTRVLATMAYALARGRLPSAAHEILSNLATRTVGERVPPLDFATICLGLEKWEEAMEWLEKACEERAAPLYQFAIDPIYDPIRSHPRAEALRLAMGLPRVTDR